MKSTFSCILTLAVLVCTSCERQQEKRVDEKPDQEKSKDLSPQVDNPKATSEPVDTRPRVVAPLRKLNRLFTEVETAFGAKDYITGIAKSKELLTALGPGKDVPHELLYFHIGLGNLLNNNMPDAEAGFKDCIQRFPKGDYTSRAYLGLGRACMMQDQPGKEKEARVALEKAAEDPKYKKEAELWISELPQLPAVP